MSVIVSLMGGLGFFLYGMKLMSEGLQKVAGSKMRSILEVFTKNRVIGLLVGIFFTALIQSSNATTVMVVSFVNSGLMKLAQAPGIILGANIGTTVTGQLIAFDLADIAPLFVIIGVLMVMFVKNNLTISRLGEVILGFGILFMGISGISGALNEAKEIPAVVNALGSLTNPFLAFLVGWVATAILQSNSATVGIIMLLAREGLMGTSDLSVYDAWMQHRMYDVRYSCQLRLQKRCKTCGMCPPAVQHLRNDCLLHYFPAVWKSGS